ncbi:unnamed protein product [Polarella glacialis]|uniref:UDP-galactose transporter n=1 Tax=Polarella glacialis TaxID=89957 RepID=A0A813E721_POLGL|nr:unnamed protein product [Polarella glacialis]|mmetsp:Transcript_68586/g.110593  ORF Transcript_68586/g.110593 Transcript_68586/m.110593 type:complete len:318 (-) Transcript_68586:79-1032(-)
MLAANNGLGYLAIHALQFGAQPLLSKRCIAHGTPTASLVLAAEIAKVLGCMGMLRAEGQLKEAFRDWSFKGFLMAAGVPSLTYLVQNYCVQVAYQNLDGIVFNILNQTKMLFTAGFVFLIVGRRQSLMQCLSLGILTLAGVIVSVSEASQQQELRQNGESGNVAWGTVCILVASALSGLGGGITEWILQRKRRNSYLLSAEMAVLGCAVILASQLVGSLSGTNSTSTEGLFDRWTLYTLIPILTQGWGGIVVGLIAKTSGSVRKGFAVMVGLILSCVLKCLVEGEALSTSTSVAVPLVAVSIYLHAKFPPKSPEKKA